MSGSGAVIETTVVALGYELVDVERAAGGLLRVTIDHPEPADGPPAAAINIDDCERVTRQLQYALEVDGLDYARLEVSSPGLDRPLHTPASFARFSGSPALVTLKLPFEGRKRYAGVIAHLIDETGAATSDVAMARGVALLLDDSLVAKPGERKPAAARGAAKKAKADAAQAVMQVRFDEIREARLVPVVNFKGRGASPAGQRQGVSPADEGKED